MLDSSSYEDQHPSSSSSNGASSNDAGFFERERNRLIQDISKGVESILGNTNTLNRKVEESISVGKEFHPISELWSKFEKIMHASGIPNLYPSANPSSGDKNTAATEGEKENTPVTPAGTSTPATKSQRDTPSDTDRADGIRFELAKTSLPPGVAPGGGRIYA